MSYYRKNGFEIEHISVRNYQHPALSDHDLEKVWKAAVARSTSAAWRLSFWKVARENKSQK